MCKTEFNSVTIHMLNRCSQAVSCILYDKTQIEVCINYLFEFVDQTELELLE